MAKRISQETFDSVVGENVTDFEMTPEEALADAIKQFKSQGVDLNNVDTTGGIGRFELMEAIALVKSGTLEVMSKALATLSEICDEAHEYSQRNLSITNSNGCIHAISLLIALPIEHTNIVLSAIKLLTKLCKAHVENRDHFEPGGCDKLSKFISAEVTRALEKSYCCTSLIAALELARVVAKTEYNKSMLMAWKVGELLVKILNVENDRELDTEWLQVLLLACHTVRGLCVHDDFRKDMSCAYDNGKYFISADVMAFLLHYSRQFQQYPALAAAALSAAKQMITTEEAVKVAAHHGAMDLPIAVLSWSDSSLSLIRSVAGVMRNLCADDIRKDRLVADGSMALLVAALSSDKFSVDFTFCEHALACLAAMSLRSPSNSEKIMNCGAAEIIVQSMRKYPDKGALQRQACLSVRNIAARCPEFRNTLLDAGVETVLRTAGRLQDSVDEAYGALRDLGCEVQYVKVSKDGKIESAYESFGVKSKLQFNPVYDDAPDIEDRINSEAHAPFEGQLTERFDDADDGENGTSCNNTVFSSIPFSDISKEQSSVDFGHDHMHSHAHDHGSSSCCSANCN